MLPLLQNTECGLDILVLRRFVATTKQKHQGLFAESVINPITGAAIDLQFADAVLERTMLTWIFQSQPTDADLNACFGLPVAKAS